MTVPIEEIAGCRAAHERLHAALDALAPEHQQQASLLPGWSVGQVLAHLVGNGESVLRRLEGATAGRQEPMYVGGPDARAAFIDEFGAAPLPEIVDRLRSVDDRIDSLFAELDPDVWDAAVLARGDVPVLAEELPFHRWREVEVHLTDLGRGATPADWSAALVERMLPGLIGDLRARTDPNALAGWLTGRSPAPELGAWL
ncbi:MAG: maleylpyruvate isomerase family mycothiol-dependent enzyme [Williamsia herbipolensis]|nr:maleylpyruvate isomerase family mycothiol-dependent enzyme [Williamsia herbipolensis]